MANNQIVISRIQHRRGRRENLPQPLLPGETAVTSDTSQVWVGQDPDLAPSSINVYNDKADATAQNIVDTNIVEAEFDATFTLANFTTMQGELVVDATVTLTAEDILYDDTYRGTIKTLAASGGTGYTTGDVVTAISATGSGFVGTATAAAGALTGVTITAGGINYDSSTTFTVANGSGGTVTITDDDIHGTTVHIAGRTAIDVNNTIANIGTALTNTWFSAQLITSGAYGGTFSNGTRAANNHTEASNVVDLINRVNGDAASQTTGLVYTNLNLEVTAPPTVTSLQVAGSDLVTPLTTGTSVAYFRAPADITLTEVRASLLTASTSGAVTVDINVNGSSILGTLLTIDQDEKTSLTAATPVVISNTVIASDDEVTVDIDGAGTGALGLIVTFIGVS